MKKKNVVALTSRIADKAHKLIIRELQIQGINGIVPSHGGILLLLFSGEKYTMKVLAERIHRTKPTVTVLVDKLVDLGYVTKEKSYEDNRVTFIALTEKGVALKPVFTMISDKLNTIVYNGISDTEAENLERILEKINHNLEES
ncbi:MarR family transcriptional regulator|nr:MarR family winged helix-turn-helix transcriptional regulator [Dendrosporobacter quercicolus]NSL47082.1 MarR family transcriptional regulator [Dendrosporobacter quercicolus DSM 1736]